MAGVQYKTVKVDSVNVFYREAGSSSLPSLLLLHGHASASHTFRNILPLLADSFHVVAPDYPGFGQSDRPDPKEYPYTFVNISNTIDKFTEEIGLTKFFVYIFDYGAPVGLAIASKHPERIAGIFTQSGNAYTDGLSPELGALKAVWEDPDNAEKLEALKPMLSPEGIKWAYDHGIEATSPVAPDAPALDAYYTHRPGALEIQLALLRDYGNNIPKYPAWQAYLREHRPKVVGVWGKNDPFFIPPGAEAFKRDIPDADISIIDAGHFLNETNPQDIVKALKKLL